MASVVGLSSVCRVEEATEQGAQKLLEAMEEKERLAQEVSAAESEVLEAREQVEATRQEMSATLQAMEQEKQVALQAAVEAEEQASLQVEDAEALVLILEVGLLCLPVAQHVSSLPHFDDISAAAVVAVSRCAGGALRK